MEKCRHCGAKRQEGHTYCPYCGIKHPFTLHDFSVQRDDAKGLFIISCVNGRAVPQKVARHIAKACWAYADHRYGHLGKYDSPDQSMEVPDCALSELALVRAKAEELFGLILEF